MRYTFVKALRLIGMMALLVLTACASKTPDVQCPTVTEEPVSTCRAQLNCKNVTSAGRMTEVGIGVGSFSIGRGQSLPTQSYTMCVDRDIQQQQEDQANAVKNR